MQISSRVREGEGMHLLTHPRQTYDRSGDNDQEFSSGPMPAAFSACLFLSLGLMAFLFFAVLMP